MSASGGEIPPFNLALRNSLVICFSVNAFCLLVGTLAAYACSARMDFWLKKQLLVFVIAIRMLPEISLVVASLHDHEQAQASRYALCAHHRLLLLHPPLRHLDG